MQVADLSKTLSVNDSSRLELEMAARPAAVMLFVDLGRCGVEGYLENLGERGPLTSPCILKSDETPDAKWSSVQETLRYGAESQNDPRR